MAGLLNSCDDCAQLVLSECEDIEIQGGLDPDTDYYWTITDNFGNKWSHTDTTDGDGTLTLLSFYFPDGFLSIGIGQLSLVIKTSATGTVVPVTFDGYTDYDCLLITFQKAIAVTETEEIISGCTDPTATNYNPLATFEDGSCVYPGAILGCTDPDANNYDPAATQDDGSCTYDPDASPNFVDIICADFDMETIQYDEAGAAPVGLFADLYSETCNTNTERPVVIVLHPGGSDRNGFDVVKYAKDFASRGYLGITADFGETSPYTTARQKQNIANVCALIRLLRANAVTYGIKKENIFVIGISAGALTALGVNVAANDLDAGDPYWDNPMNALNASESSAPLASATQSGAIINAMAAFIDAADGPNFWYHGTLDTTMAYSQAINNYNDMIAAGLGATFVPYIGEGHSVGSHHDEIILGGDLQLDGVTVDTGIVVKFANLLVP